MADISTFTANLSGGSSRPNQFSVNLIFPAFVPLGPLAGRQSSFLCKAASLPAINIGDVQAWYRGRPIHLAGERLFQPWLITIYNDTNFNIRNAFEQWSDGINSFGNNTGLTNPIDYQTDMSVFQLDRDGQVLKPYTFINSWPSSIGEIQLDYENNNQIETFQVQIIYDYYLNDVSTPVMPSVQPLD